MNQNATSAPTMPQRSALLVLGMHRSGTSALTRSLSLLGADLPEDLMPPVPENNETGFWESMPIYRLNEEILESGDSRWDDWRRFDTDWYNTAAASEFSDRALKILEQSFSASPLFVLKDPRICRLLPFWLEVLERFGSTPHCVLALRNPLEVASSLGARNEFSNQKSLALWLRHLLDAEVGSRHLKRGFVSYASLLQDWKSALSQLSIQLELVWPNDSESATVEIDRFLQPRHCHHQFTDQSLQTFPGLSEWVTDAYHQLSTLTVEPGSTKAITRLDHIRSNFDSATDLFGDLLRTEELAHQRSVGNTQALRNKLQQLEEAHAESLTRIEQQHLDQTADQTQQHQQELGTVTKQFQQQLENKEKQHVREVLRMQQERDRELHRLSQQHSAELTLVQRQHQQQMTAMGQAHAEELKRITQRSRDEIKQIKKDQQEQLELREKLHKQALNRLTQDHRAELLKQNRHDEQRRTKAREQFEDRLKQQSKRHAAELAEQKLTSSKHRTEILIRLNDIQSSPSWQFSRPIRKIQARWPNLVRRTADLSGLAWAATRLQLKTHLGTRRAARQVRESGLFDANWYIEKYPDVVLNGADPILHWVTVGWTENRDPNPLFDTHWYIKNNPDVREAGLNPLLHYIRFGATEGRDPSIHFNTLWYVKTNPDVVQGDLNPLAHYLQHGRQEGRRPRPSEDPLRKPFRT